MVEKPTPFCEKLFATDRLARQALHFLGPELRLDVASMKPAELVQYVRDRGESLLLNGCYPGWPCWLYEENLDVQKSVRLFIKSMELEMSHEYFSAMREILKVALAGYGTLGTLFPRLAGLRWVLCLRWLVSSVEVVAVTSHSGHCGPVRPKKQAEECRNAKDDILRMLRELVDETEVLSIFDYDVLGEGVWRNKGKEPLPIEAHEDFYRRGVVFDIASMCRHALRLPPTNINDGLQPILYFVQPHLTPTWELPPPHAPRTILERNGWYLDVRTFPTNKKLPEKFLVEGPVLHMDRPPDWQPDYDDPEVMASLARGEDQGKGHQEDGLPGALHGSIGMMFASVVADENIINLRFNAPMFPIEHLFDTFTKFCPRIRSLDLSNTRGSLLEEHIEMLRNFGNTLFHLDLEDCGFPNDWVDTLIDSLMELKGLRHLDLGSNDLDGESAARFISIITEQRIDLTTVRLDRNPLGDLALFRDKVAMFLAIRGQRCVSGGDLVINNSAVHWKASPGNGSVAERRLQDEGGARGIPLKLIEARAYRRFDYLDKIADEKLKTVAGEEWLFARTAENERVFEHPGMQLYRDISNHSVGLQGRSPSDTKEPQNDESASLGSSPQIAAELGERATSKSGLGSGSGPTLPGSASGTRSTLKEAGRRSLELINMAQVQKGNESATLKPMILLPPKTL